MQPFALARRTLGQLEDRGNAPHEHQPKLAVQTTADLIRCALAHGVTVGPRVSSDEVHSELTARDRLQAG